MPLTSKREGKEKALGKYLLLQKEQIEDPLIPQARPHVLAIASDAQVATRQAVVCTVTMEKLGKALGTAGWCWVKHPAT